MLYPSKFTALFWLALALPLSLALLQTGCGLANGTFAKAGTSGVRGTALIGGVSASPVVVPYAVVTAQGLTLAEDDTTANLAYTGIIAQAQANALGRFVLPLRAGTYLIAATNVHVSPSTHAASVTVTVGNNTYKQVNLIFPASP